MNGTSGRQEVRSSISQSPQGIGSPTSNGLNSLSVPGSCFVPTVSSHSPLPSLLTCVLSFCFIASNLAHAQVSPITPSGLNTQISDPIAVGGQTQYDITGGTRPGGGANLFHSFGDFSVPTNHIANFFNDTGLPTSNILGRVTGGNLSNIFGTIQTEGFPNANLFVMNPAGFLFGPNATVNVSGMVAFTSADYLKLTDNARFNAIPNAAADALLTALPVASFGFLGSNPGAITVQGSQFSVTGGQSISLVGGNISIESGTPEGGTAQSTQLSAPNGKIQLASAASPGEFDATTLQPLPNVNNTSFTSFGSASLAPGSNLNVSGENTVSIRGGQFILSVNNAVLSTADNAGVPATISLSPGSSMISSNAGADAGADVQFNASNVQMDGASIQSTTTGDGSGGNITADVGTLALTNGAMIRSSSLIGRGQGGNVRLNVGDLQLLNGAQVMTATRGAGTGGAIDVTADSLLVSGVNLATGSPSSLVSSAAGPIASGTAGNIHVVADSIVVQNGGQIRADLLDGSPGNGGNIDITAGTVDISNRGLIASSTVEGTGPAGRVDITANDVRITGDVLTDPPPCQLWRRMIILPLSTF